MKRPEHMIWIRLSQTDQPVAVGPKSGPWGLPKDLRGPQKGLSGLKRAFFGGPRSSVEVSEGAQAHGMDAGHLAGPTSGSWAKSRSPGPSEDLWGPRKRAF